MESRGRRSLGNTPWSIFSAQFALSDTVDERQITADLKHGVLTVTLPKAEAATPRQIAVQAT